MVKPAMGQKSGHTEDDDPEEKRAAISVAPNKPHEDSGRRPHKEERRSDPAAQVLVLLLQRPQAHMAAMHVLFRRI